MGAQKHYIGAARVDVAIASNTDGPPEKPSEDDVAWIRHASTMRELAFLLGVDAFGGEIGPVAQHVKASDPEQVRAIGAEGANGLMADYLAESENLFALLTKMAENGQLDRLASQRLRCFPSRGKKT
jgi:hypothetical protein